MGFQRSCLVSLWGATLLAMYSVLKYIDKINRFAHYININLIDLIMNIKIIFAISSAVSVFVGWVIGKDKEWTTEDALKIRGLCSHCRDKSLKSNKKLFLSRKEGETFIDDLEKKKPKNYKPQELYECPYNPGCYHTKTKNFTKPN